MRYRLLSIVLWLYTMMQPEINIMVVIIWIIAFFAMSYKWTYIFSTIILVSLVSMHYSVDTWYYICLFLAVMSMSMFIAIFTIPYGSVTMTNHTNIDGGYYDGGGDGGE